MNSICIPEIRMLKMALALWCHIDKNLFLYYNEAVGATDIIMLVLIFSVR